MMDLIAALLIASFAGTITWLALCAVRPFTQTGFSQTWHYYSSLIPVFFLLGGSDIVYRFLSVIRSVASGSATSPSAASGQSTGVFTSDLFSMQSFGDTSLANVLAGYAGWFEHRQEWIWPVLAVWTAGAAAYLAVPIRQYRAFKRSILQDGRICKDVRCPVNVIVSANATTPMLIGLWKPVIVLPDTPLEKNELAMILSHELVHFKRGDLLVKLLVFIANALHWFNPVVYWLNKRISMFCELSCDEKVVRNMDAEGRRRYGETLLSMMEYSVKERNVICTSHLCSSKKVIQRRLVNLMNEKKTKKTMIALSIVAAIALAGTGGTAAYAAGSAMPSKNASSKPVEGRNITIQYPDGTVMSYDADGNPSKGKPKGSHAPRTLTQEEINDRVIKHIEKGLDVPQGYIDGLSDKELKAINDTYGLNLKKSK
jgi:Antirepressor regulating drug resistance, predicted signal transduction N-terminal membrane component